MTRQSGRVDSSSHSYLQVQRSHLVNVTFRGAGAAEVRNPNHDWTVCPAECASGCDTFLHTRDPAANGIYHLSF